MTQTADVASTCKPRVITGRTRFITTPSRTAIPMASQIVESDP